MLQRKAVLLGSVVLLTLALGFGCSLLPREESGAALGYSIKLRIQTPAAAKGITVGEFDVTGLHIEVLDPAEQVLASIEWVAAEGMKSYDVPVPQPGLYRIVVTHMGGSEEDPVQATEEAAFEIRAMKITVIDIVPGGIGLIWVEGEASIDVTGYWDLLFYQNGQQVMGPQLLCLRQTGLHLDGQFPGGGAFHGSIEGADIDFALQSAPDSEFDVFLKGTVSGDQISGEVSGALGEGTFTMTRSTLPFGHWDLRGSYQEQELPLELDTEYAIGSKGEADDPPGLFILWSIDTELSAYLWINVVGDDLEAGRDYAFPNEAGGSLHWSPIQEGSGPDFDTQLVGPGTLHIYSCSAEGIAGTYAASLQGGGSISGSFDVSFVEDW